ncbi:MAG: SET domain-containing protein-lysine N-methyltransferase [Rickettsiaceae bacterium]
MLTSKCINILTKSDRYTLQKSTTHHIYMDAPSIFINHSCDPNLGIRDNQYNAYDFIAIKPIYANDELTFDYETAEETVDFFDKCLCASKQCRKSIIGFKHYEDIIRKKYGDFIADYLKK